MAEQETIITDLIPAEVRNLVEKEVTTFLSGIVSSTIETDSQYRNSGELVRGLARYGKTLEDNRVALVRPYNTKVSDINSYIKGAISKIDMAKEVLNKSISAYERKKADEAREVQRIADEKARKERERIENEAREKREKEEKLRKEAEEKRIAAEKEEDEKKKAELLKQAQKIEIKADTEAAKADVKEQVAQAVVAPVISTGTYRVAGRVEVKKYRAEVSDKEKFVRWCVEFNKLQYLEIDTGALSKMLQASKGMESYPGINCKVETEYRQRT